MRFPFYVLSLAWVLAVEAYADGGTFCNGSNIVEWTCGGDSPGGDWVPQGGDCYHRATSTTCGSAAQAATQYNASYSGSPAPAYVASVACDSGSDSPSVGSNGVAAKTTAEIYAETGKCIPQSTINNNAGKVFWATKGVNLNTTTAEINKAMGWSGTDQHGMISYGANQAPTTTNFNGAVFGGVATVGPTYTSRTVVGPVFGPTQSTPVGRVNENAINASFQSNSQPAAIEKKAPTTTNVNLNRLFSNSTSAGADAANRSPASNTGGSAGNKSGASKAQSAR